MSDLLYWMNTEGECALPHDEDEIAERLFDEALGTPGVLAGVCPFCGEGHAYKHENGVCSCCDCLTVWVTDSVFQRLTESEDARSARLALEYQTAHSKTLFD